MKIKITLIAFLASAMMFTSCMKNESSPGIESVREAYASLLLAKAQAEVILANANASFLEAQAAVQLSQAAINDALAAKNMAEVADLQAALAQQLIQWGYDNAATELAVTQALAAYELTVIAAKNLLVTTYYTQYTNALTTMRNAQQAIFNLNTTILNLGLDIANGTYLEMPDLVADADAKLAILEGLQAEYEVVKTLLGNVDAIDARVAELEIEEAQLENQRLTLAAELVECAPSYAAEETAAGLTNTAEGDALTALNNANAAAVYAAALASFPNTGSPAWWATLVNAVTAAENTVTAHIGDTATASTNYYTMLADITAGTDVLDDLIVDQQTLITGYNTAITAQEAIIFDLDADTALLLQDVRDSLAAFETADAAVTTQEELVQAYVDRNIELEGFKTNAATERAALVVLRDGALASQSAYTEGVDPEWDIYEAQIDDYNSQIQVIDNNVILWDNEIAQNDAYIVIETPAIATLQAVADQAETEYDNTVIRRDAAVTGVAALIALIDAAEQLILDNEGFITTAEDEITNLQGQIPARLDAIAQMELDIIDLLTELRHQRTFMDEYVLAVTVAEAAKEARRIEYEQYMDETFAAYWLVLQGTAATALATWNQAVIDNAAAQLALTTAKAPCQAIIDAMAVIVTRQTLVGNLLTAYGAVATYNNVTILDTMFDAAITTATTNYNNALTTIDNAQAFYDGDVVDYGQFMIQMASLEAELATAQTVVANRKALLDEALANL